MGSLSTELVVKIINDQIQNSKFETSDLMIVNYPGAVNEAVVYPRPSDQIIAVEKGVGEVRLVCVVSKEELELRI